MCMWLQSCLQKNISLQTADEEFDKLGEDVTKKASLLVHHLNGATAARKRFGAMLGMAAWALSLLDASICVQNGNHMHKLFHSLEAHNVCKVQGEPQI